MGPATEGPGDRPKGNPEATLRPAPYRAWRFRLMLTNS